ncbi:MAG: hypothetical protein HRU34_11695 [Richelia sp.]|nr:hypothetical protein [Richelia sp.]
MPLPGTTEYREAFPQLRQLFLAIPLQYPPKGVGLACPLARSARRWRSHLTIKT